MNEELIKEKTYRAIRHDIKRAQQKGNAENVHHPDEKINQLLRTKSIISSVKSNVSILELFGGWGNLTKEYLNIGGVTVLEKDTDKCAHLKDSIKATEVVRADSFLKVYELISKKRSYDIVDADPYGFPNRLFPHIFLMMKRSLFYVTIPKPYVNILNGMTQAHLHCYYNSTNPSLEEIVNQIAVWGLCHWRKVEMVDALDLKSVWRVCFFVERVKATDYTGVVNRPSVDKIEVTVTSENGGEQLNLL